MKTLACYIPSSSPSPPIAMNHGNFGSEICESIGLTYDLDTDQIDQLIRAGEANDQPIEKLVEGQEEDIDEHN